MTVLTFSVLTNTVSEHSLSAAFDTVDHTILLKRLQYWLGTTGTALKWFCSYLSGRSQRVSMQGLLSDQSNLNCGGAAGILLRNHCFLPCAHPNCLMYM